MPNTINIPTPLRPFTDKKEAVEVSGATVGELLLDLTTRYEGLRKHLYADNGKLRNFVNVYLNDEDIRYLQREATPVKAGDTLSIVPSVAGGAPTTAAPPETDLSPEEIKRYSRHLIMPASSTSTSLTTAICSDSCCTRPTTWAGRSSSQRETRSLR